MRTSKERKALVASRIKFRKIAEQLNASWSGVLRVIDENLPPRSHEGSCGPESGCDMTCVELSYVGDTINAHRRNIRKIVTLQ